MSLFFLSQREILEKITEKKGIVQQTVNAHQKSVTSFIFQQPVVIIWDDKYDRRMWYIIFHIGGDLDANSIRVDHIERVNETDDKIWCKPQNKDIQEAILEEILPCQVKGECKFRKDIRYEIENIRVINHLLEKILQ